MATTLTTVEAASIFAKLKLVEKRKGYHVRGFLYVNGKLIAVAQYPHGRKDLPGRVPTRFRESLYLDEAEFRPMKKCTTKLPEYLELLRSKGKIV